MYKLALFIVSFIILIVNAEAEATIQKRPRQRLDSIAEILDFIRHAEHGPLLLTFIPEDEDGNIMHRDNENGAYSKFLEIDKQNHDVAMGLIVCNELPKTFGVEQGMHFIQVELEDERFKMLSARFYSDSRLANYHPGSLIAIVNGEAINPISDKNLHQPNSKAQATATE